MGQYRKKPVVIEAVQILPENDRELLEFFNHEVPARHEWVGYYELVIHTLEGRMLAKQGDWLIRGVQGEVYPCKPDIFEETYEKV